MEFSEYISSESNMSVRQIALACGYQPSKLTRQLNHTNPLTMETVRDIARATKLDMLELLVKSGHLTQDEVNKFRSTGSLAKASEKELADEIYRRMMVGATYFDEHSPFENKNEYARAAESDDQPDLDEGDLY